MVIMTALKMLMKLAMENHDTDLSVRGKSSTQNSTSPTIEKTIVQVPWLVMTLSMIVQVRI